jgi:hypothetical protein
MVVQVGVQTIWGVPWSSWLLSVSAALLAIGVLGGVVVGAAAAGRARSEARRAQRAQKRADQARLFASIVARWDDPELLRVQRSLAGMDPARFFVYYMQLDDQNHKRLYQLERLASFFEDLGTLERLQGLDIEWIDEALGSSVVGYWKMWQLVAVDQRARPGPTGVMSPDVCGNWQRLSDRIEARRVDRAPRP